MSMLMCCGSVCSNNITHGLDLLKQVLKYLTLDMAHQPPLPLGANEVLHFNGAQKGTESARQPAPKS